MGERDNLSDSGLLHISSFSEPSFGLGSSCEVLDKAKEVIDTVF